MRGTFPLIALALSALALPGCHLAARWRSSPAASPGPSTPALTPHQRQVKRLEDQIARLKQEQGVLQAKLDQVESNEKRLYERLRDLQFDNDQLRAQVKHLATVPAERDKYKQQVASLQDLIIKLRRHVAQLESSAPATKPTPKPAR